MGLKYIEDNVFFNNKLIKGVTFPDFFDTVGKNAKKIQEYIQNQLKEDWEYDQMSLKEYIDPFTGEPVKQSK